MNAIKSTEHYKARIKSEINKTSNSYDMTAVKKHIDQLIS